MSLVSGERPSEGPRVPTGWSTNQGARDEPPPRPDRDVVFEVLRTSRRREALRYLDAHDGEASVGAMAEYIAAEENGVDRTDVTYAQRKRAYVGLYQMHLPKMADLGVVDWDRERGHVALRDAAWWILAHLYFDPDEQEPIPDGPTGPLAAIRRGVRRLVDR